MNVKWIGLVCVMLCVQVACRSQFKTKEPIKRTYRTQKDYKPFIFSIDLKDRTLVEIITGFGQFNYDVDSDLMGPIAHDYGKPGTYTIRIRGHKPHVYCRKIKTCVG